jgi:crossover junction endonuclease MUS81
MLLKIDTRETELKNKCIDIINSNIKFKDIQINVEPLPLGDVIINDGNSDCMIIERKTLADLASSIKDGRYEEQSYRLNGNHTHNHNIVYIIEGDLYRFNAFKERMDKQTLYSSIVSINYFKGFSVIRTNNIEETAHIICTMLYKIVSDFKKTGRVGYYKNKESDEDTEVNTKLNLTEENTNSSSIEENTDIPVQSTKDYCNVVKKVKKDNITTENIGEIILSQLPGISSVTAIAILSHFKTLPNLIQSIQNDEKCLDSIQTTDSKGKSRKINKNAIATILKYLKN